MSYSITNLKADVEAALHGTTVNQIQNLYGLFNRAARDILLDIDPQEQKRIVQTSGPIYNGVWDYPIPSDLKGNRLIDIRPQVLRSPSDLWTQEYNQDFDIDKSGFGGWGTLQPNFTINFNTAQKSIRINAPNLISGVTISTASAVTGNGTWVVGGGASSISTDNQNWVAYGGSLSFNLLAGQASGYVENSTLAAVNLSNNLNQATQFLYTYLPTASSVTSVDFRLGSSPTDYYSVSTSQTQQGTVFQNAWNLLAYAWLGAAVTGSPNPSAITYVRVTYNYDSTLQTAVRLDGIQSILGRVLEIEYYSKFMFRNAISGAFQDTVTSDNDLINLDTESYQIYFNRVMFLLSQQVQGLDALFHDGPFFQQEYEKGIMRYQALYKSEVQKPQSTYYQATQPGYSQYFGGRWFGG